MARTKRTPLRLRGMPSKSCYRPVCYEDEGGTRHIPASSRSVRYSLRSRPQTQKPVPESSLTATFTLFPKLPQEIQSRVWELAASIPRLVCIYSRTADVPRAPIPPLLHVCSTSRAIGLKHYSLTFGSQPDDLESGSIPPRVYFNYDRDVLYFRENWNEGVEGPYSCISSIFGEVNGDDLKRVRRVGFDVNARVCCLRISGEDCHPPSFRFWDALEAMFLGFEGEGVRSDREIWYRELEEKDYEAFMRCYRMNPCWMDVKLWPDDGEAVEQLRSEVPWTYHGDWRRPKPDHFLRKIELVSIV